MKKKTINKFYNLLVHGTTNAILAWIGTSACIYIYDNLGKWWSLWFLFGLIFTITDDITNEYKYYE